MHVRPATRADLPALGRLGAHLMRVHYEFDRRRFVAPTGNPEAGYAHFLGTQSAPATPPCWWPSAAAPVGYVYAGIEPFSWKELREAAGFVHDSSSTRRNAGAASPAP